MDVDAESDLDELLELLLENVGGLCGVSKVALSLGDRAIAAWSADGPPDATCVIVNESVAVGVDGYQLTLFDRQPRQLSKPELNALRALGRTVQRTLADRKRKPETVDTTWVSDHVAAALDYITDAFLLLQGDWTIQHVNTQFERFTAKTRDEILGRGCWDACPELVGTRFEHEVRFAMGGTVVRSFEEFNEPLGRWLEHRAHPCANGLAVLTIDVTERKSAELAAARAQHKLQHVQRVESLGTLASGIAHDVHNVLGAVLGNAGLLADKLGDQPPDVTDLVQQIRIAGDRGRERAKRLLAFGRKVPDAAVVQDLHPAVDDSLALLRATLPAHVDLRTLWSSSDVPLYAIVNATDIQQLVINLCTNAWHSLADEPGVIQVGLRRESVTESKDCTAGTLKPAHYATLSIIDNGTGMAATVREHLFEPFFTTKPRGSGTGLGLYVVHEIVMSYGGALDVRSVPGAGTSVSVYLPLAPAGPNDHAMAEPPRATPASGAMQRIACVDDDEVMLLMTERLLTRAGFQVTVFDSPHAFLEHLSEIGPTLDLLVTDHSMPGMSGLELARQVRAAAPRLPIICNTGLISDELRTALSDSTITSFVSKERTYEDLPTEVARILADRRF